MTSPIQRFLIGVYGMAAATGITRAPIGRRAFELAYLTYKSLIEVGPLDQLKPHVTPGSTVIDVGANLGFFTCRFAEWVEPDGRVIAIEPEPQNIASLRRRLARSGHADRVEIIEGVASERSGTFKLSVDPTHPGNHRIAETGVPVSGWALDDLMAQRAGPPVSFIKIDVQGAEVRVIEGAVALLSSDRPVLLIEIDPAALAAMGESDEALFAALGKQGYVGYRWTRHGVEERIEPRMIVTLAADRQYLDALFLPSKSGI